MLPSLCYMYAYINMFSDSHDVGQESGFPFIWTARPQLVELCCAVETSSILYPFSYPSETQFLKP